MCTIHIILQFFVWMDLRFYSPSTPIYRFSTVLQLIRNLELFFYINFRWNFSNSVYIKFTLFHARHNYLHKIIMRFKLLNVSSLMDSWQFSIKRNYVILIKGQYCDIWRRIRKSYCWPLQKLSRMSNDIQFSRILEL